MIVQVNNDRYLVVESMMTTSSMGTIITTKNCQFLMGGELSEVGTTGHQETGASCNAPTQLTISCLLTM